MKSEQKFRWIPWVSLVVVLATLLNEAPVKFAGAGTVVPYLSVPIMIIGAAVLWRYALRHAGSGGLRVLLLAALAGSFASAAHAGSDFLDGLRDGLAGNPSSVPEAYASPTHFVAWAAVGVLAGLVLDRIERHRSRALAVSRDLAPLAGDGRH
jgi:hypothetical protein